MKIAFIAGGLLFIFLGLLLIIMGPSMAKKSDNPEQRTKSSYIYGIGYITMGLILAGYTFVGGLISVRFLLKFLRMFFIGFLVCLAVSYLVIVFQIVTKKLSWEGNRKFCIVAPIVIALVLGLFTGFSALRDVDTDDTDSYGNNSADARIAAEDIVRDNLKSPSSADFCGDSEYTITRSGNTWTVRGYVDAQNSFGATLRNDFTVVITFTSETKYTIDSCRITAR